MRAQSQTFAIAAVLACAGSAFGQSSWNNPAGGNWNLAANWMPWNIPNSAAETALLGDLGTPYTVVGDYSGNLLGLSLHSSARLELNAGLALYLGGGGVANDGVIFINNIGSAANSYLAAVAECTVTGNGRIELNSIGGDLYDATLGAGGALLTIGTDQLVHGSGAVSGPAAVLGTIEADRDGRDLALYGDIDMTGGLARGINGGKVALLAQVTGGTLAGGVEVTGSTSTINGSTTTGDNAIRPSTVLNLIGSGLTNNGTITVNTTGSSANAILQAGVSAVLDGSGNIDLNSITGDLGDATLGGSAELTIGASQSITGSGAVRGPIGLAGTINADRDARDIAVYGAIDASSGGTLTGSNGGKVALQAQLVGGTLAGGVEVSGVTATIDGSTATDDNAIRPSTVLNLIGSGLTNNGTITVNTTGSSANAILQAGVSAVLDGSGNIDLNSITGDLGDATITTADASTFLTIDTAQTITGSGLVIGSFIFDGTINADRDGRDIALNGAVDASGGGTLMGSNNGKVALQAQLTGGTLAGGVEVSGVTATINGSTATGANAIRPASVLSLIGAGLTNNGTITINPTGSASNASMLAAETTILGGSGITELNSITNDPGDATLGASAGAVLTIGPSQKVTGRGRLTGTVVVEGTLTPGSAADPTGDIDLSGAVTLAAGSTTAIGFAGASADDFDRLTGNGTLALDGTLDLSLIDGFSPAFGQEFLITDVGSITGEYDAVITPAIGLGLFRIVIGPDTVKAVWTCQADLTGDGVNDIFDLLFFLNAFTNEALYGDYNEDGVNDFFDILQFLNDFAAGC